MRSPRLSAAAAPAAVAVAFVALPTASAGARSADQIRDAIGDARAGQTYVDIVTARWSSTGRGDDKALVGTLTLAAPPKSESFTYEMFAEVRGCGRVLFQYHPGTLGDVAHSQNISGSVWTACGGSGSAADSSTLVYVPVTVTGKTITWTVPLAMLPSQVGVGAVFSRFAALADVGEPVFGTSIAGMADESLDYAVGDGIWRLR